MVKRGKISLLDARNKTKTKKILILCSTSSVSTNVILSVGTTG